ncbi:MAG: DNA repair protein RecN [Acidobacteria bacterium]|nr:MAG: DNA repair protein RecN [Acidobacteriota bacterium]
MLRELRIENLVLARRVELSFSPGLNLITGETGAGKSLLVGALALALGGRGEASMVRQGEERAVVEALFDLSGRPDLVRRLATAGYDPRGDELLIRREIGAEGRSRALIGGSTVTLSLLRELTAGLVEMHGQHEQQSLLAPENHREILDRFARHGALLERTRRAFGELRECEARLKEHRERAAAREARRELIEYRLAELEAVAPKPGEEEELRRERERLRHAEEIGEALAAALQLLYEGEGSATEKIHAAARRLHRQADRGEQFAELADRLDDVRAQVDEIAADLRSAASEIAPDPERLAEVEDRLHRLDKLRRRFDGAPLEDLIAQGEALRRELAELEGAEESAAQLAEQRQSAAAAYLAAARELHESRRRAAGELERKVASLLEELAMPKARLEVHVTPRPGLEDDPGAIDASRIAADGLSGVEFHLRANPGEPARPLRKVASGGELSRLMLALDVALEGELPPRTLLFDEVDQGLGGQAADRLGEFLSRVSRHHQVICITHLPQVASRADTHVTVTKKQRSGRTVAVVKTLTDLDERVEEVARMLAGSVVTDTARRHAEAMIRGEAGGPGRSRGVAR